MPRLESFENTTGKNFLKQVLNKLHIKYAVRYLNFNDAISPKSNFMYQKISIPSLNVIRLLEHVHEHFPPYMISVPWLFDDAHTNKDEGTDTNIDLKLSRSEKIKRKQFSYVLNHYNLKDLKFMNWANTECLTEKSYTIETALEKLANDKSVKKAYLEIMRVN
jgi:hypothetical protein